MTSKIIKWALIAAGTILVGLAIIGILLPILPTTPFLLLAAACYARSSDRFYKWLMGNRFFGGYIKNYREGKGIPLKVKAYTISLLWATILVTAYFFITDTIVEILLLAIAVGVTVHVLSIRPRKR